MAKEKKRGFFSWLGFGQKEQTPEKETEVQERTTGCRRNRSGARACEGF